MYTKGQYEVLKLAKSQQAYLADPNNSTAVDNDKS